MGSSQSTADGDGAVAKPSLYQRHQEKKRGPPISDEDLKKYTGKTREEFDSFAASTPGVGKNQLAGKISVGPASGLAGGAAGFGFGGWGPGAEPNGPNRGMKFPPKAEGKVIEEEE